MTQPARDVRPMVIDTDPGIDDALALMLALRSPEVRVDLITTVAGSGNNASFRLVKFVSATVVKVKFNGNPKELRVQPCVLVDDNGVPDIDDEIGEDTTMFTNLILIR